MAAALFTEPVACQPGRLSRRRRRLPRHSEATGFRWTGCRDGTEVIHYRINGGGHEAPRTIGGRPVAEVVRAFFAAHPLPG